MRFSLCSCFNFNSLDSPSRWEVFLVVDSANFSFHSLITVLAYCNSCSYFFRFLSTIFSHFSMAPSALLLRSSREWLLLASALFCLSCRNSLARSAESLCFCSASWWARAKRSSRSWWCCSIPMCCESFCLKSSRTWPRSDRLGIFAAAMNYRTKWS